MFNEKVNYFTSDKKGLSMSEAQSISNVCNQKSSAIIRELDAYNICSKTILMHTLVGGDNGTGNSELIKQDSKPIDAERVKVLLAELGTYAGLQAFLMEHIKLKAELLKLSNEALSEDPEWSDEYKKLQKLRAETYTRLQAPVIQEYVVDRFVDHVDKGDILNYLLNEANAAKIGSFIHKDSKLQKMRNQLDKLEKIESWSAPDGRSAIVRIDPNVTDAELGIIYEDLAKKHKEFEKKVNGFKARASRFDTDLELKNNLIDNENSVEANKINKERAEALQLIDIEINKLKDVELKEHITMVSEYIVKLAEYKIAIPDQLQEIVSKLR